MADASLDIVAMGDAIVDVIADCDDDFIRAPVSPGVTMARPYPEGARAIRSTVSHSLCSVCIDIDTISP